MPFASSASICTFAVPDEVPAERVSVAVLAEGVTARILEPFDQVPSVVEKRTELTVVPEIEIGTLTTTACEVFSCTELGLDAGEVTAKEVPADVTVSDVVADTVALPAAFNHSAVTMTLPATAGVNTTDEVVPSVPVVTVCETLVPVPPLRLPFPDGIENLTV